MNVKMSQTKDKKKDNGKDKKDKNIPVFLADFMGKLLSDEKFCDVEFAVGEQNETVDNVKVFKAHRLVLAAHSPLFQTMLLPPTPNAAPVTKMIKIRVRDATPEAFQVLLTAIYTDKVLVNDNNVQDLIVVGKKYQIEKVQIACATHMQKMINAKNICEMFETYGKLLGDPNFGLDFIRDNFEAVSSSNKFLELSKRSIRVILCDDKLSAEETHVFQALQKWGKAEAKRRNIEESIESLETILKDLLHLIRFPTMEMEQLATVVAPSKLISEDNLLLLYQYSTMMEEEDEDDKKDEDDEELSEVDLARIEKEKKEHEECKKKVEKLWNIKPRSGAFIVKKSKIIKPAKYKKVFFKFFNIRPGGRLVLKLLYRGSTHGFTAQAFHEKCDNKPKTLTIIKAKNYPNIFGGYFGASWSGTGSYVSNADAWLFSLVNKHNKPVKLVPSQDSSNIYLNSGYGPTWGGGHDLYVCTNMQSNSNYCNPNTYRKFADGFDKLGIVYDNSLLAGSYNFTVEEIEVFQITAISNVKKK